jgi:hypothetical protein
MLDAIRGDNTGPTLSSRNLAILHTAIFDSVNSIEKRFQPYMVFLTPGAGASSEAAAVGAAHKVMQVLYPTFSADIENLYNAYLSNAPAGNSLTSSIALGTEVATRIIEDRSSDGSATQVPYIPSDAPGQWRRTPPFFRPPVDPQWGFVTPFCIPNTELYIPGPPPAMDSPEYAASFNEVKSLGSKQSLTRTAEQTLIADFWSDFSYTAMPPGHWHEITADIVRDHGLSLSDASRLFALVSLAQADAAIVCWAAKYRYNLWRPITAIQRADEDGNPDTIADPAWNHYLASPPFPSYMSGHSTFSKASSTILARYFGSDSMNFSARSDSVPGVIRHFTSFAACADEVGMSRIYGGIHYQFDNVEGKKCGDKIADFISRNFLLPNNALPSVIMETTTNGLPRLRIQGHFQTPFVLERATNLEAPVWTPIYTNVASMGGATYEETNRLGPNKFYRVRE